ncbi:hypothetical protein JCM14076_24560 [Methylosoma difficile]
MATIQAPLGEFTLTGNGTDRLKVDYSTLTEDIFGTPNSLTDEFFNTINFSGFASFDITGGSGNDTFYGANSADSLVGGGGDDTLYGGLGADNIDGGTGLNDLWVADYSSLGVDVAVTLNNTGASGGSGLAYTISATSASVKNIEALNLTTGSGNDSIDTSAVVGNDWVSTGEGDDLISSGLGLDTIYAGGGNDTIKLVWVLVQLMRAAVLTRWWWTTALLR